MMLRIVSIISIVLLWGCNSPKEPVQINLEELTISDIHQAYKNGHYSSEDLVKAYLDKIESENGALNALRNLWK